MSDDTGARQAADTQSRLFKQYAAAGLPALKNAQNFTRGALDIGEPGYVQSAYQQAATGAESEGLGQELGLRGRLTQGLSGGALSSAVASSVAAGGAAISQERSNIGTTRALATVEQRNKLLGILAGQGAGATNLAAGFGSLANAGIGSALRAGQPGMQLASGLGALGASTYLDLTAAANRRNAPYWAATAPGGTSGSYGWQGFSGEGGT